MVEIWVCLPVLVQPNYEVIVGGVVSGFGVNCDAVVFDDGYGILFNSFFVCVEPWKNDDAFCTFALHDDCNLRIGFTGVLLPTRSLT